MVARYDAVAEACGAGEDDYEGAAIEYVLGDVTDDDVLAGAEFDLVTSNLGLADGERSTLRQQVGANHRTLATYVNTLSTRGLSIERMVEPAPEPTWAATMPEAAAQPVYLVVACRRTAS